MMNYANMIEEKNLKVSLSMILCAFRNLTDML
jgi:hypothetical protein